MAMAKKVEESALCVWEILPKAQSVPPLSGGGQVGVSNKTLPAATYSAAVASFSQSRTLPFTFGPIVCQTIW